MIYLKEEGAFQNGRVCVCGMNSFTILLSHTSIHVDRIVSGHHTEFIQDLQRWGQYTPSCHHNVSFLCENSAPISVSNMHADRRRL